MKSSWVTELLGDVGQDLEWHQDGGDKIIRTHYF